MQHSEGNKMSDDHVKCYNHRISDGKMQIFNQILVMTGGRYIGNPIKTDDGYLVNFSITVEGLNAISRAMTRIVEVRSDQWWKILYRRIKFMIFG